jgi:putative transposase
MAIFSAFILFFRSLFFSRISLATEILVLRQQLLVLNRTVKRPNLRPRDRLFWVCLSRLWKDWRDALIIVKPDTVIKWHREGFRLYWRWKSKAPIGRPTIDKEIRELIRRISSENPLWGAPRIQSELRLLGLNVTEKTVAKYRVKLAKPPSQTWKTFLANHANQIAAVDFFTIPTINFRVLYCFIVLLHGRRKIVHFNVTTNPTAQWAAQQIIEAFPDDTSPRYLLRDRDSIYGTEFRSRVKGMQIDEVVTAPHSPFQNPYAERVIGSIRRECLDHLIVLNEDHLRRILRSYFNYYYSSSQYSFVLCPLKYELFLRRIRYRPTPVVGLRSRHQLFGRCRLEVTTTKNPRPIG